jgi:hypothetical protein
VSRSVGINYLLVPEFNQAAARNLASRVVPSACALAASAPFYELRVGSEVKFSAEHLFFFGWDQHGEAGGGWQVLHSALSCKSATYKLAYSPMYTRATYADVNLLGADKVCNDHDMSKLIKRGAAAQLRVWKCSHHDISMPSPDGNPDRWRKRLSHAPALRVP